MAQKIVLLCDVCGDEGAVTLHIQIDAAAWTVDACPRHRKPVEDLVLSGRRITPDRTRKDSRNYDTVRSDTLLKIVGREAASES